MQKQFFSCDLSSETFSSSEKPVRINKVFSEPQREFIEISIKAGEVLARHKANVPIAILGIIGSGTFFAGESLSESQILGPGVLITLDKDVLHQVEAEQDLRFLLIKFLSA